MDATSNTGSTTYITLLPLPTPSAAVYGAAIAVVGNVTEPVALISTPPAACADDGFRTSNEN
eukprot:2933010-Rhodomonas_salina.1